MIPWLALALWAAPAIQEPEPGAGGEPRAERWWRELPPAQQEAVRERFRQFQRLPAADREELRRRAELLAAERRAAFESLDPAERQRLERLPWPERLPALDHLVRQRLEARSRELEARFPGAAALRGLPLPERLQSSARLIEESHQEELREAARRALEEGWIGPQMLEWLQEAPLHEKLEVLGTVQKWRVLREAQAQGLWERWRLDPAEQRRVAGMAPRDFFRVLDLLKRGVPKEQALAWPHGPGAFGFGDGLRPGVPPRDRQGNHRPPAPPGRPDDLRQGAPGVVPR